MLSIFRFAWHIWKNAGKHLSLTNTVNTGKWEPLGIKRNCFSNSLHIQFHFAFGPIKISLNGMQSWSMEFGNVIFSMGEIAGEKQTASDFRVSAVRSMKWISRIWRRRGVMDSFIHKENTSRYLIVRCETSGFHRYPHQIHPQCISFRPYAKPSHAFLVEHLCSIQASSLNKCLKKRRRKILSENRVSTVH